MKLNDKQKKVVMYGGIGLVVINAIIAMVYLSQTEEVKQAQAPKMDVLPQDTTTIKVDNRTAADIYRSDRENKDVVNTKEVRLKDLFGESETVVATHAAASDQNIYEQAQVQAPVEQTKPITQTKIQSSSSSAPSKTVKNTTTTKSSGGGGYLSSKPKKQNEDPLGVVIPDFEESKPDAKPEPMPVKPEVPGRRTRTKPQTTSQANTSSNALTKGIIQNNNREIKDGSTVKLRNNSEIKTKAVTIPINTVMSATATLEKERLVLRISSVNIAGKLYAVNLTVYDLDGVEGLYAPSSLDTDLKNDAAGTTANKTTTSISVPLVGSISTNIANSKIKDPSIKIANGHKLLIKNNE